MLDIAVAPDGKRVYAATDSAVRVLHGGLHCVEATIPVPAPVRSIALAGSGTGLSVTGFDGSLSVIHADNAIRTLLDGQVTQLAADPRADRCYAALSPTGVHGDVTSIAAIDAHGAIRGLVELDANIVGLALGPDGRRLYAATAQALPHRQYELGSVVIIDTHTCGVIERIPSMSARAASW